MDTRLTKGNEPPPKAFNPGDESIAASSLTGETRESKAKAYGAEATKNVSLQYVDTINKFNGKHEETVTMLQKQLDNALRKLQNTGITNSTSAHGTIDENASDDVSGVEIVKVTRGKATQSDDDLSNDSDNEQVDESEDDENMSNLSESSSDGDNYPIMEGIRTRKLERENKVKNPPSPFRKGRDEKYSFNFNLCSPSPTKCPKGPNKTPVASNRRKPRTSSTPLTKGSNGGKL